MIKIFSTRHKLIAGAITASVVLSSVGIAFADTQISAQGEIQVQPRTLDPHVRDLRASTTAAIKEKRGELKDFRATTTLAIKNMREEEREDLKAHHASTTIAIKARLDAKKQDAVMKVLRNRIKAEQKHINQLSKRTSELSTVMLKIKAAGRDTAQAEGFLIDAKAKLALASSSLASINVTASSTVSSTTPGQKLNQYKTQFDAINDNLKIVHKDLAEAISSLKGIGKGIKFGGHATTTTSTGTTTVTVTASTTTSSTQ